MQAAAAAPVPDCVPGHVSVNVPDAREPARGVRTAAVQCVQKDVSDSAAGVPDVQILGVHRLYGNLQ